MLAMALTLALAVAAGEPGSGGGAAGPGAEPPDAVDAGAPAPAEEGAAPAAADPRAGLRGWRQDLALGLHSTTFWSYTDHHYTFHSMALGYLVSWGQRGLFIHATGLLPLQGHEDGRAANIHEFYSTHYGGDLLTGYQWRWQVSSSLQAEAGGGPHATFLVMKGVSGYRDFSASPLGLGAAALLRWRTGHTLSRWPMTVGLYGSAAVDLWDPIHGQDLRHGFTFSAGMTVGLLPGGGR